MGTVLLVWTVEQVVQPNKVVVSLILTHGKFKDARNVCVLG